MEGEKSILAIRHVDIEHLGILEPKLIQMGFGVTYLDTAKGQTLDSIQEIPYSMLVVLGGYMGAYEEARYPFLTEEYKIMEAFLKKGLPILGICLGAQMLAKVLGAKVYRGERGEEVGWCRLFKVQSHRYFEGFPDELIVFQWHQDTFDLPEGAINVYSSSLYENQAFCYRNAVGIQFHLEVDKRMAKAWFEASKEELSEKGVTEKVFTMIEDSALGTLSKLADKLLWGLLQE